MRLILRLEATDIVFRVAGALRPETTVTDILLPMFENATLFDGRLPSVVDVDQRRTPVDATLDEALVFDGSILTLRPADSPICFPSFATVDTTGGLNSGDRRWIADQRLVIGRAKDADITVTCSTADPYHFAVEPNPDSDGLLITDLGTLNGTLLEGAWLTQPSAIDSAAVVDVGTAQLTVRSVANDHPNELLTLRGRTPAGHLPFNRPPRPTPPAAVTTVSVPAETMASSLASIFSWAGLLAPLALGALMAWLFNPLWALFALMGPVMMVGTWFESRRRNTKSSRRRDRRLTQALDILQDKLTEITRAELRRRRSRCPDPAELARRVFQPSTKLWQRRTNHLDALEVRLGTADLRWNLEPTADGRPAPAAVAIVADASLLAGSPLIVDLVPGKIIGIAGPTEASRAVARSILTQIAVHHGPADIEVVVITHPSGAQSWEWTSWLPHTRCRSTRGRTRSIAKDNETIGDLVGALLDSAGPVSAAGPEASTEPMLLCIIDGNGLTTGRSSPSRSLLAGAAGPASGIVIASTSDMLPQDCTTVIDITDPDGIARVATPASASVIDDVLLTGIGIDTATRTAQRLARYADPEVDLTEAAIPTTSSLVDLLAMTEPSAAEITRAWQSHSAALNLRVPIGVDGHGIVSIDLVTDGPHALIGGTTGSGKSELLRTMVAGLAAQYSPRDLNFMLIDYKGGSAFDQCAELPHTVGLVTDLDEHLGARALRCLDAELSHRERVLRAAAATDITAYHQSSHHEALPRLVVVIDEFATLAAELPDFLDALVGVAQRGRSLGVHLVLATQRPSGAVSPSIRTNTNLRIALRVLDATDSADVIDKPDAASIPRDQPGRACIRLGPSEVVAFQAALVTGRTSPNRHDSVRVVQVGADAETEAAGSDSPTDLERLVAAINTAHRSSNAASPRRPWPDPLPDQITLHDLEAPGTSDAGFPVGLADLPDQQRQQAEVWDPLLGNAIFVGMAGSGTSTAVATTVCSIAGHHSPDAAQVYAIDYGSGALRPLDALPHVGSIVEATDQPRQLRLLRRLDDERRRRSALSTEDLLAEPMIILVIDGYGSWRDEMESDHQISAVETFSRIYSDGPSVKVYCLVTADHPGALNRALLATTAQIWMFRFADPSDYLVLGRRISPTEMPAGRAFTAAEGSEVQFALPHRFDIGAGVSVIAKRNAGSTITVAPIGELPSEFTIDQLDSKVHVSQAGSLWIPVGIGDDHLHPVGFELYSGEHAQIAGRARTGKTTALIAIAQSLTRADISVVALAPPRSALLAEPSIVAAASIEAEAIETIEILDAEIAVLVIDDADTFSDPNGAIEALANSVSGATPRVHVVAAGRTDRLLSSFGHWTKAARSDRVGVVLSPEVLDGDLFGVQLPLRSSHTPAVGRGYMFGASQFELCQVAMPGQRSRRTRSA